MPNPDHLVKFGVGDIYHTFTPGVNQFQFLQTGQSGVDTTFGSQLHYAHEISAYAEDDWKINSKLKGNEDFILAASSLVIRTIGHFNQD